MKLTIVGATGGVGRHVLEQAVTAGHDVTAVVRNPGSLAADVHTVRADLQAPEPAALESAIAGADGVISCLGPRKKAEFGIVSRGTEAIVDAMTATGVRRLVVASGTGVHLVPTPGRPDAPKRDPHAGWLVNYFQVPMARRVLGRHFVDTAMAEDLLRTCDLAWTAVRLPFLTDKPARGTYRTVEEGAVRRGLRLARADAAEFLLRVLDLPATIRRAVAVAY